MHGAGGIIKKMSTRRQGFPRSRPEKSRETAELNFRDFSVPIRQIFWGNLLLIVCCAFYLAWWLLAFKPAGAVKGMKTGWLLIPATAAGAASVLLAVQGIRSAPARASLFPNGLLLWGGIAAYFVLLAITRLLLKRPVTTELFLIVGWAALALSEVDALYGAGVFPRAPAVAFAAVVAAAAAVSLVCYVLYYRLDSRAGYFDGMVPLLTVALVMGAISVAMAAI